MARIIFANGAEFDVVPKNGIDFSLEELQGVVDGYIEIVRLRDGKIMVVNEEGRLIGLKHNAKASALASEYIVGNVLVCDTGQVR